MSGLTLDQLLVGSGVVFLFLAIVGRLILPKFGLHQQLSRFTRSCLAVVGIALLTIGLYRSSSGPINVAASKKPTLTSSIRISDGFYPGGWMGDYGDIHLQTSCTGLPDAKWSCFKIVYSAAQSEGFGWAGIYWLYPDKNWGTFQEGRDLTGAKKLVFWARGEKAGERAEFKVGGVSGNYPDSIQPPLSTGVMLLSDKWQKYTIDLEGRDLHHVIGGFCWVTNMEQNPSGSVIYVAEMRFVP